MYEWMNEMWWRVWIKNNKQYDWKSCYVTLCYDMTMLALVHTHTVFIFVFALVSTRTDILQSDSSACLTIVLCIFGKWGKNDMKLHMNCITFERLGVYITPCLCRYKHTLIWCNCWDNQHFSWLTKSSQALFRSICRT